MNNKNAFWQALVFTILVFVLGIFLGFFLESSRADTLQVDLMKSEVNLLDQQLRNKVTEDLNIDCSLAIKGTFDFADKIYAEAVNLEKYDSAIKLDNNLNEIHRRYDLLRAILWIESLKLRERCGEDFHTVVYFYQYRVEDLGLRSRQNFFARILEDVKAKYPQEILLIPIAANMNLDSVNLALANYGITEVPVILIDENKTIHEVITLEELEKEIFG